MDLRTIKIFLASSSELKEDRRELELAILRKNEVLKNEGVFLEMIVWEDFLDSVSATRLQNEYNKSILQCDFFIMLFFTKVGKFTFEEFKVALNSFKKTGKPKIYTYFKNASIDSGNINEEDMLSMLAFKKKLKDIGHYFTTYNNIDGLKYHFSEQLSLLEIVPSKLKRVESTQIAKEIVSPQTFYQKRKKSIYILLLSLLVIAVATTFLLKKPSEEPITNDNGISNKLEPTVENNSDKQVLPIADVPHESIPAAHNSNVKMKPIGNRIPNLMNQAINRPTAKITPIEFNAGENSIQLYYQSYSLGRRDAFKIDPNQTVGYLRDAIKLHYRLSDTPLSVDENSENWVGYKDVLVADHKALINENWTLKKAGVKTNDVIEFISQKIDNKLRACRPMPVLVEVMGIKGKSSSLILNAKNNTVEVIEGKDYYKFYFDGVGECQVEEWTANLWIDDKTFYLTHPYNISLGDTLKMRFNLPAQTQ